MKQPGPDHPITVEKNPHRIRVVLGGFIIAETTQALTLHEASLPPMHYIPSQDVRMDLLERSDRTSHCPYKGDASYFTAMAGGLVRENAATCYESPYPVVGELAGHVAFAPGKVDDIEEFMV
ncbi:DUF427 domain-containing protein [Microvirga terricola]|uniref:DUF427 domain-containing protein n=1 Tax=Microvirga terricola TaxID=2719797 RepID=A0ABX0V5L6_9HYPH|nr:DUF427 domain-containing protein [Microvirga terricola]NIX75128.1 DUF427 domain-containing protein [Microvirga terricola]